jgi:hypothetical protein
MTTPLEDRLSAELMIEANLIDPGDIPPLRAPAPAPRRLGLSRRRGRRWPSWATGLAAAAAVLAVLAGALTIGRAVSGTGPDQAVTGGGPARYARIPPYYAYAVQGDSYHRTVHGTIYDDSVLARYVKVKATHGGKVLATVSPPAPDNSFVSFTGDASDGAFVFAAQRLTYGATGQEHYQQDLRRPLTFTILRITPGGRTHVSRLSLPETLTAAQQPTLALSPDGTRLAVAYGGGRQPAVVQVITLATGRLRQWTAPHAATPVLTGLGAWTSDGRVLAIGQMVIEPDGTIRNEPEQTRLLDTAAPGTSLTAGRLVTLHGSQGFWSFLTPDGTKLITVYGGIPAGPHAATEPAGLGVYSARTGALLRVVGRSQLHGWSALRKAQRLVAWSDFAGDRLIVEIPQGTTDAVGYLTGRKFSPLPAAAGASLVPAMNSGGFQTSGGYVGFAW